MSKKLYVVVGMMGDIEVCLDIAETLDAAIFQACVNQGELGREGDVDEEDVENMNSDLAKVIKAKMDNGRYDYAEHEDDMDVTWRFKRTVVRTRE